MTLDFEDVVTCALVLSFRKKRRRKVWINPLLDQILLKNQFHKLNENVCAYPKIYWLFSDEQENHFNNNFSLSQSIPLRYFQSL